MAKNKATKQEQTKYDFQELNAQDLKEITRYYPEFKSPDFTKHNARFLIKSLKPAQTRKLLRVAYKKNNAIFLKEMAVPLDFHGNQDSYIDKLLSEQWPEFYQKDDFTQQTIFENKDDQFVVYAYWLTDGPLFVNFNFGEQENQMTLDETKELVRSLQKFIDTHDRA